MRRRLAVLGASLAALIVTVASGPIASGNLPVSTQRADWATYGFDTARTGFNPSESALGTANVGRLHVLWRRDLGAVTITSPTVATRVPTAAGPAEIVVAGTEHGDLLAVDAADGRVVWQRQLGLVRTTCYDTPDDVFGISATPVIDRAAGRIYVADSNGPHHRVAVFALDLATGATEPGWPVTLSTDPSHMHVWGALTLAGGSLYVTLASLCDFVPSYGRVAAIDVASARVTTTWYVVRDEGSIVGGGGIWGFGGASVDPVTGTVYVATGNAFHPEPESQPYAERVVALDAHLDYVGSDHPQLFGRDVDFGSTPVVFRPARCPAELAVENKSGALVLYAAGDVSAGPVQRLQIAGNSSRAGLGLFIGMPAWSPVTGMLYVANPGPDAEPFRHGMVALRVGPDCQARLAWQHAVGGDGSSPVSTPTVANGVAYYADGLGQKVFAFGARTGRLLWTSAGALRGAVFAAPVVADGRLYVAAWDGRSGGELIAFGP